LSPSEAMMTQLTQCVLIAVLVAVLPVVSLAQSEQASPAPAPASTEEPQVQGRGTYEPETTPLSGSQLLGLGFAGESLNVLNIGASVHEHADSNIFASGTDSDFRSVTSFVGTFDLNRIWKRNSLSLHYTGGGSVYTSDSSINNMFHSAGIAQSLSWQRWTLRLGDDFTYSPYAPYSLGPGGFGYSDVYGSGNLVLHPGEVPDQSIYSTRSSRLANTVFANLDYAFSRRTALTFSGSYGVLRFEEPLFFDSDQYGGGIGLSHQLTGHDSISVNYRFSRNQFHVVGTSFETHTAEFRYGRRITGRLGLELWGGPQINYYNGPAAQRDVIGSVGGNLRYRTRLTEYWVGYNRGVRGGSGVLLGSVADTFSGGLSREFGRNWSMTLSGGYSHNSGLITASEFNNGYGGVFFRRSLGQYAGVGFNYALHRQTGSCVTGNCPAFTRQIVGVSFDWHLKPIRLE
jgi:hypothetical protein